MGGSSTDNDRFNVIRRSSLRNEVDGSFDELEDVEDSSEKPPSNREFSHQRLLVRNGRDAGLVVVVNECGRGTAVPEVCVRALSLFRRRWRGLSRSGGQTLVSVVALVTTLGGAAARRHRRVTLAGGTCPCLYLGFTGM